MAEAFEDITVTRFELGEQNRQFPGLFAFRFMLSRKAPSMWVEVAGQDIARGSGGQWVLGRHGEAYSDRLVIDCTSEEAQKIKDKLNSDVLPNTNSRYRRAAAEVEAREDSERKLMEGFRAAAEKAVKKQK